MNPPAIATVDRFLQPLAGTTLLLGLLLLWQRTYDQSCAALVTPGLVYIAILYGLLEYRLERKRFAVHYYLDRRSSWRRRLRGTWLPVVTSMVAALPLAVFLVVFAALSRPTEWLFLAAAAVAAPFLFDRISRWPGRHFRRDTGAGGRGVAVADILSARLAGWVLLALIAIAYVYFNYMVIGGPPYIYPDSLQLTVEAFTAGVRSECPVVDDGASCGGRARRLLLVRGDPRGDRVVDARRDPGRRVDRILPERRVGDRRVRPRARGLHAGGVANRRPES